MKNFHCMGYSFIIFRRNFLIIFFFCLFPSCVMVNFKQPQPPDAANEKAYPKAIQGSFKSQGNDTLVFIEETYFQIFEQNQKGSFHSYLSDSNAVLRKDDNFYYLNLKNDSLWNIYILKIQNDSSFSVYSIDATDSIRMEKLKKITGVISIPSEYGKTNGYIINPTKPEFKKMIKDSVFAETIIFRRMR